jgi:putative glycosyltransferase
MKLSIVTPMYYSAPYIETFYAEASAAAEQITADYEIILVNDGSPDQALDIAISLYHRDPRVRVIDLSRNFGQHKAIMTGLARANGDLVFLIDCDLEIRPAILAQFYSEFQRVNVDVVYGVQDVRQDRPFDRIAGQLFYSIFNLLSNEPLHPNLTTVRLMSQRYVSALVAHRERELLIGGLWLITGFKQIPITVTKLSKGSSTYHIGRKLALIVNAVTSFSNRPLVFIFYLGLLIIFFSSLAALFLVSETMKTGFLPGWPSLIVSVWLLGGLTIFCIGIIGIYLSKIFIETKQRPYTIIRQIYDRSAETAETGNGIRSDSEAHRVLL